jgi:hypothetical protein
MALSKKQKKSLDMAMGGKKAADRLVAKMDANLPLSDKEQKELEIALADKKAAAEIIADLTSSAEDDQDAVDAAQADLDSYTPAVAAEAVLDITADITLVSVAEGAARNTNTFTLQVLAPAANTDDEILVAFTGTSAAIVCTVTPNDGTNNSLTPVDLTSAELVELINSGVVVGKNAVVTDASSLRALQTASGGDATALADAGEGDGEVATFSGGADESPDSLANLEAALAAAQAQQSEDQLSSRTSKVLDIAMASKEDGAALKAEIEK